MSPPPENGGRLLRLDLAADARREMRVLALGVQRMAGMLLASGLAPAQREQADTLRTLADSLLAVVDQILDPSQAAGAAPPPAPPEAPPDLPDAAPDDLEERPPDRLDESLADALDESLAADGLDERLRALDRLAAATGEDVCRQVIEDFLGLGGDDLASMRQALDRRDGAGLATAARSLAGSSGMLGAAGLATDCVRLELAAARLGEPDGPAACASRLEIVERGYRALAERLAERLTPDRAADAAGIGPSSPTAKDDLESEPFPPARKGIHSASAASGRRRRLAQRLDHRHHPGADHGDGDGG